MSVTTTDHGADHLLKRLRKTAQVRVGVIGDEALESHGAGLTTAEVASYHEFGTLDLPRRSWLRDYVDENETLIRDRLWATAEQYLNGQESFRAAYTAFGTLIVGEIQERISNGIPPPISAATERQRGPGVPLINTGQFRSSITAEVVE